VANGGQNVLSGAAGAAFRGKLGKVNISTAPSLRALRYLR